MVEPSEEVRVEGTRAQRASLTLFDGECAIILSEAWSYLLKVHEENERGEEAA